jgi:hypothetical protein
MKENNVESSHENSLEKLSQEFGPDNEMSIRAVYREERLKLEKDARVTSFIPILACKATREAIKQKGHVIQPFSGHGP